ncbi:hypothetical protein C5167_014281 [Papaver somniferum]|uniref:Uncharacterized protein n=1 Tax=Papaver somniferum TaxID=3469 RepID=A0A4Y7J2P8_PAPSO|nr:hypothetical protein C5167_014281 [Papaver somniferum]
MSHSSRNSSGEGGSKDFPVPCRFRASVLCQLSPSPSRFRPNLTVLNSEALPSVDIPRLSRNLTIVGSEVQGSAITPLNSNYSFDYCSNAAVPKVSTEEKVQ